MDKRNVKYPSGGIAERYEGVVWPEYNSDKGREQFLVAGYYPFSIHTEKDVYKSCHRFSNVSSVPLGCQENEQRVQKPL